MGKITSPKNLAKISQEEILHSLIPEDATKVGIAIDIATKVYADKSLPLGESILEHTLGIAKQVANLNMDVDTRVAALLSRVLIIEPKYVEELEKIFGVKVVKLIRDLDKLRRINLLPNLQNSKSIEKSSNHKTDFKNNAIQTEALRKMLLVLADDIRIIFLQLVGQIQTLHYIYKHPSDSAREIAYSSLQYFAPLANRLSIHELKWPIEDWAFRILEPETYKHLAKSLNSKREERECFIDKVLHELNQMVANIKVSAEIKGRAKHLYSIYKKMQKKNIKVDGLYDLNATRVLVDSVEDCYRVLDILHNRWEFVQSEFDDYIARPKDNGYQSLHTVVLFEEKPVEVQIRTYQMHQLAESGLASHWRYKEGVAKDSSFEIRLSLLRELMDWQKDIANSDERLQNLAEDTIYCLTPKGEVFDLPPRATPIDFAYRIHTNLGHRCRGAKVDGALVPLTTELKSGQCVEIIFAKDGNPSRDWLRDDLGFIKSSRAKSKVRQFFNTLEHAEKVSEGKNIWLRMQSRLRTPNRPQPAGEDISAKLGYKQLDDFYLALARADIGMHHLQALIRGMDSDNSVGLPILQTNGVKKKIKKNISAVNEENEYSDKVTILDLEGLTYQKAACCSPTPPVSIIGYITRNNIVSVHNINCREFRFISNRLPEKVVAVAWRRNINNQQKINSSEQRAKSRLINNKNQKLKLLISGKNLPDNHANDVLTAVMNYAQQNNLQIHAMQFNLDSSELPATINIEFASTMRRKEIIKEISKLSAIAKVEQLQDEGK